MQFILCFGRELLVETHKSGAAATAPPMKKIRRPNAKPLDIHEFYLNHIEEHYLKSHRKKWAEYKSTIREEGMSHATNDAFVEREKIITHYARQLPTSVTKYISLEIGALTNRLYSSEHSVAEFGGLSCVYLPCSSP